MDRVRVGIIGVGQIGKYHIKNYKGISDVEIVAIADKDETKARQVACANNIPYFYTNYSDLLARDDIHAVDICLHNNLHMPVALAAFDAGKHVFSEKPIAGSYIDGLRMVEMSQSKGLKLSIQLNPLFSPETKAAKKIISKGLLGHIYHARSVGYRRRGRPYVDGYGSIQFVQNAICGGGAIYDMGVYHIACMLYLLGNPQPSHISGKIYQEIVMDTELQQHSGYDVEEFGIGLIRLENNITLDILEAWAVNIDKLEGSILLGSKAGIRLNPFGYFYSIGDLDFNATVDLDACNHRNLTKRQNSDAYENSQCHWIAALQNRIELLPTANLALNTALISEGIYLSDKLGREVTTDEVQRASVSKALQL